MAVLGLLEDRIGVEWENVESVVEGDGGQPMCTYITSLCAFGNGSVGLDLSIWVGSQLEDAGHWFDLLWSGLVGIFTVGPCSLELAV
jgi:hypothetical protein